MLLMGTSAGRFNHIIEIQHITCTQNEYGEQIEVPTDKTKIRANIYNLSNNRTQEVSETFYTDTKQVEVRKYLQCSEYDHVIINNKEYRIVNIIDDELKQTKTLNVEEINT